MKLTPLIGSYVVPAILTVAVLAAGRGSFAEDVRQASCPCRSNQTHAVGATHQAHTPGHFSPYSAAPLPLESIHPRPATVTAAPVPPPGSLGRTYQLRSWSIPADKHPRIAMLDLRIPGATDVRVINDNEYRNEDEIDGFQDLDDPAVWHFETEPLIPGVPHVYRVDAVINGVTDVRYVRLIRSRRLVYEF